LYIKAGIETIKLRFEDQELILNFGALNK